MFRATVTLLTVPALVLLLGGCGDDPATDQPLATETARNGDVFNAADVEFATATIPLHAEALAMVDLTLDRVLTTDLKEVIDEISLGHAQEVQEMTGWLTAWDEPVPETVRDHVNAGHGDEHEGHEQPTEELERLATAGDDDFEQVLLELLVDNHEDTIAAAKAEQEEGAFGPATELATAIRGASEDRVDRMEDLLGD